MVKNSCHLLQNIMNQNCPLKPLFHHHHLTPFHLFVLVIMKVESSLFFGRLRPPPPPFPGAAFLGEKRRPLPPSPATPNPTIPLLPERGVLPPLEDSSDTAIFFFFFGVTPPPPLLPERGVLPPLEDSSDTAIFFFFFGVTSKSSSVEERGGDSYDNPEERGGVVDAAGEGKGSASLSSHDDDVVLPL